MKKNPLTSHQGFTLIEVILSIAILSVVSVVALRLFIVSYDLNETSRINDLASMVATNTIEDLRQYDQIDALLASNEWLSYSHEDLVGSLYYGSDFEISASSEAVYQLDCSLVPIKEGLYAMTISVKQRSNVDEPEQTLIAYSSKQYFQERSMP